MTDRTLPAAAIVAAGVGLGFAGDQLLRAPGDPGLNFFLLFAMLAASVWIVARSGGAAPGREAWAWIGVGVLCAAALVWRGSGLVRFAAFVGACAAFALPAREAGRAWTRRARVLDVVEAAVGSGLNAAFGATRLLRREHWEDTVAEGSRSRASSAARKIVVGVLLALAPLTVFGALFMSADAVFATLVEDFVRIDLQSFASHLVLIGVLAWLTCGYLAGFSSGTRLEAIHDLRPSRPRLGVAEVATALALVDALFLGFVAVQFRYMFGGAGFVAVTPGLTYAEYARAGFFQLVAAVALAIPWLLATHGLLSEQGFKGLSIFRGFAGAQLLLLFAIVGSAIQRMLAYQAAYGLTEERVVVTAVLVALTAVLVWFGVTVLGGRPQRFAFGGLVAAFLLAGSLQVMNPAAMVARHNLDRIEELGGIDAEYLGSLGSDAAPLLVDRLDELPAEARCVLANRLIRLWGPDRSTDWRSFNLADSRARASVAAELGALTSHAAEECG